MFAKLVNTVALITGGSGCMGLVMATRSVAESGDGFISGRRVAELGRIGTTAEFAGLVVLLASDDCRYVIGIARFVAGGLAHI